MNELEWWLAPLALFLVWWLVGRPGWPKRRTPPARDAGRVPESAVEPASGPAVDLGAPLPQPESDKTGPPPPRTPQAAAAAAEQAAREAEAAMREARESARRELAERERLEREAAAREREQRERAQARRVEAELAARAQAERIADEARQRAAQIEQARRAAEAAEAAEAAQAAEAAAAARAAAAEAAAAAERARLAALARTPPPPQPAAATPQAPLPAAPARLASQTLVMIADDSKVVRVKTSRLLAAHQYRVLLAEDGEQAMALLAREQPQVLITDVEMPGLDGLQLTRALRADPHTAALPVVMITSSDERLRDEAAAAGVTVLLGKPYADEDLIGHVARLAGVQMAV